MCAAEVCRYQIALLCLYDGRRMGLGEERMLIKELVFHDSCMFRRYIHAEVIRAGADLPRRTIRHR